MIERRTFLAGGTALALAGAAEAAGSTSMLHLIEAPQALGLRPPRPGHEPGTWRAPDAYRKAGLHQRLAPARSERLPHPPYDFEAQPGTRIRNGNVLRSYTELLAQRVGTALDAGGFVLVLGGDCAVLLGCLLAARRRGRVGLLHVDGHSDFFHPGNYDNASRLGSAAGMDLALATGRGEALLTRFDDSDAPLVADADVVQIGERENTGPDYAFRDIEATAITRLDIQSVLRDGVERAATVATDHLRARGVERTWLHIDLDVLDERVLPAVDSPGAPGLDFDQLARLGRALRADARVIGADVSVFDPDLDPDGRYAAGLADCLARIFA
jgi:arginase